MITSNRSSLCMVNKRNFTVCVILSMWDTSILNANARYCLSSGGCIVVCLYLPSTSRFALFSPFIDQQELDEFSCSDAPRHAADECLSGTRTFFTLLDPCVITHRSFLNSCNFCNLKKIIWSYIIPTFAKQHSRRDSALLTVIVSFVVLLFSCGLLPNALTRLYK